ncbi:MAG: hypothetical protein EOM02_07800 [Synergistales bacterium]|nr:hypothetical protein [Synergistales bacterium]
MTTINIRKAEVDDPREFYFRYEGQCNAQPVYLYLDLEDGELFVSTWESDENSFPAATFNGTLRRWEWSGVPTPDQANDLMEKVAPLGQKMLDDSEVEFIDGNWTGTLGEEAESAERAIEKALDDEWGRVCEMDPSEYFGDLVELGITAETTDKEIEKIVAEADYTGDDGELYVVLGAEAYLQGVRDDLKEEI